MTQASGISCRENAGPYPSCCLTLESEDAAAGAFQEIFWIPCRTDQASFVLGAWIGNSGGLKTSLPTLAYDPEKGKETA
jgi:hypothetical protein